MLWFFSAQATHWSFDLAKLSARQFGDSLADVCRQEGLDHSAGVPDKAGRHLFRAVTSVLEPISGPGTHLLL